MQLNCFERHSDKLVSLFHILLRRLISPLLFLAMEQKAQAAAAGEQDKAESKPEVNGF